MQRGGPPPGEDLRMVRIEAAEYDIVRLEPEAVRHDVEGFSSVPDEDDLRRARAEIVRHRHPRALICVRGFLRQAVVAAVDTGPVGRIMMADRVDDRLR